jgi:hypothetical protein
MVPYEATVVGFCGDMVGLLVWRLPNNTLRDGRSLAINGQNLMKVHNSQAAIDDHDSVEVKEVVQGGKCKWGDVVPSFRAMI